MGLKNKIKVSEWCCAVRLVQDGESILNNTEKPFTVLSDSYRYWTADPFLYKHNGKYFLFFELFDRLKRKGLLGYREITGNKAGKLNIIYECDSHLSYPYIYSEGDDIYIIPESSRANELFRLKCISFPDKWEKEKVLYSGSLADTTMLKYNDNTYYISEKVDGSGIFNRVDLFFEKNGVFCECKNNPVKLDVNTARCAGSFFEYDNMLIRPSQDCGDSYGKALNFNQVLEVNQNNYLEKLYKTIKIDEISLDVKNNFSGIHTYNRLDNIEVIDLKMSNVNLLNPIGAVLKRIKLLIKGINK